MIAVHDILGRTKLFRECELRDVLPHFQKIKHWIPAEEALSFQRRMDACVSAGQAFAMADDSAFLYYKTNTDATAEGVALFGKDNPVDMLALFVGIFGYVDTRVHKMDFKLHPGKFVDEYKSLLTETSIRRAAREDRHVVVRIDELKAKIKSIFKTRGFE